jgi:hypothetical protein
MLAFCLMTLLSGSVLATDLIGDYRLIDGTLNNGYSGPGALESLTVTQSGGFADFGPSGWAWSDAVSPGSGLNLSNLPLAVTTSYSIGITAFFGETDGYRRLIDFKNQASDTGLYVHNNAFQFYEETENGGSTSPFQEFTIVITRDDAKNVNIYTNANSVPILSFVDNEDLAVASANLLKFFQDDEAVGGEFATIGSTSLIRVWNGALTPSEIANAMTIVPEPSTYALSMISAAGVAILARRRRNSACKSF